MTLVNVTGNPIKRPLSCGDVTAGARMGGLSNTTSVLLATVGGRVLPVTIQVEFPLHTVTMG